MSDKPQHRPLRILMAEDSPTDAMLTREALEESDILSSMVVVQNGVEALAYLRQQGQFAGVARPDLILLDLNMPKMGGIEVLAELKSDPLLRAIPVVILTTSKADTDIARAYGNHANCYIAKPIEFADFSAVVHAIQRFWFDVVTLPAV
jgi:CheY-like chemotaxis protein